MSEASTHDHPNTLLDILVKQRGISMEMASAAKFNAQSALETLNAAGLTIPQIDAVLTVLRNNVALYRDHSTLEATDAGLPDVSLPRDDLFVIQGWGLALRAAIGDLLPKKATSTVALPA